MMDDKKYDLPFESDVLGKKDYIKYIDLKSEFFLGRSTIIYGQSGTGKTRIIKQILKLLQNYVPICSIICPTNESNNDYTGIVPLGCIKKSITVEKLETIYKRQETITRNCNIARRKENLMSVYKKLSDEIQRRKYDVKFSEVKRQIEKIENSSLHVTEKESLKNQAQDKFYKWILSECKSLISKTLDPNSDSYLDLDDGIHKFTEDELITIEFMDTNPNILILFDDAVTILSDIKKSKPIQDMFYNGRHSNITTIISLQNDKGLPPELRTGAFNSMFPGEAHANLFVEAKGNGFSPKERKYMLEIINNIFTTNTKHQQKYFMYRRLGTPKYGYNFVTDTKPFKFGCKGFWDFHEKKEQKESKDGSKHANSFQTLFNNILDIKN